ncbi:MAG TPA: hypothetical protein HPP77_04905 [Candidatus Hydrogenedentes bacterium]|nr:hypothetical protein [Candidatus Hydrogenedentota bacterium]
MNNRERALAVLNYQPYDRLPIVHFGFWNETLERWAKEGHVTADDAKTWHDGGPTDKKIGEKLGFDLNWGGAAGPDTHLKPPFERKVVEEMPGGARKFLNGDGVVVLERDGATSIPSEVDHLLKDRASWEEHYKFRLQFDLSRVDMLWRDGGREWLQQEEYEELRTLACGSLFGRIRNLLGLVGVSYLYAEDEALFDEIIETVGALCYECVKTILEAGAKFDVGHFWEDICFKGGPLIIPSVFDEKVGPQYKRITDLLRRHGVNLVSVDCDGCIDALIPTWLDNGVNVMFPIEVGTWHASIKPWREQYGRELRGVGGMDKRVFAQDYAAIDAEIERLKPLVELGGYLPCPDHRIAPDAKWENVRYYCERMRQAFGE